MFNLFFGQNMNTFWVAIGAVSTVLAFIVAFIVALAQSKEKNKLLEIEQASEVSGWLEELKIAVPIGKKTNGVPSTAYLNNNSSLPIYNVYLLSSHLKSSENPMKLGITHYMHFDIVAPGARSTIVTTGGSGIGDRPALAVLFSDAKGTTWLRTPKGLLIKLKKKKVQKFLKVYNILAGPYTDEEPVEISMT